MTTARKAIDGRGSRDQGSRGDLSATAALWLLAPLLFIFLFFFLAPIASLLFRSFSEPDWTAQHYARLVEQPLYLRILWRTVLIAVQTTAITLLLGYPIAMLMTRLRGWTAMLVMACVFIPLWASVLVRSYAWIILLQRNGIVNSTLKSLGLIDSPFTMLYTNGTVLIAMSHVLLPYMILPLYSVMRGIPDDLSRAALGLGASRFRVFLSITLPLSLPGVFAGMLIVFVLALGFYITPALVGGPRTLMISTLISQQVTQFLNFPFAGAISTVLLVLSVGMTICFRRLLGQGRSPFHGQ